MFFSNSSISAYKQTANLAALTKSPQELLDMVFEEIEISTRTAANLYMQGENEAARLAVARSIELIQDGLIAYVDPQYAVSKDILAAYSSWVSLLVKANINSDIVPLTVVLGLVGEMRSTFAELDVPAAA